MNAILKVRLPDGTVVDIPSIKGTRGEQGVWVQQEREDDDERN